MKSDDKFKKRQRNAAREAENFLRLLAKLGHSSRELIKVLSTLDITWKGLPLDGEALILEVYDQTCRRLNVWYGLQDAYITHHEGLYHAGVRKVTRKLGYSAKWIGNVCVDLLYPSMRVQRSDGSGYFIGVAFEVDGKIHDATVKAQQDTFKDAHLLERMNIYAMHVENQDIFHPTVLRQVKEIGRFGRPNTKEVRALELRCAIMTIAILGIESDFLRAGLPVPDLRRLVAAFNEHFQTKVSFAWGLRNHKPEPTPSSAPPEDYSPIKPTVKPRLRKGRTKR